MLENNKRSLPVFIAQPRQRPLANYPPDFRALVAIEAPD